MFRKIIYSKLFTFLLNKVCSLFYPTKYLKGKFFDEKRMGYFWALSCLLRTPLLHRKGVYWPVGRNTQIMGGENIHFDNSSINIFQQPGCYYQAFAKIIIGKNVWIGQNTGLITANHKLTNPEEHEDGKQIILGDNVWIGMNCVILPGVELGNGTIVGAGSIVTKSFVEGNCVIAGNPAKLIKKIGDVKTER